MHIRVLSSIYTTSNELVIERFAINRCTSASRLRRDIRTLITSRRPAGEENRALFGLSVFRCDRRGLISAGGGRGGCHRGVTDRRRRRARTSRRPTLTQCGRCRGRVQTWCREWSVQCSVRMRGEAGGARGRGAPRGSSYPAISSAYWLPPSNPTPYHVPGDRRPTPLQLQTFTRRQLEPTWFRSELQIIFVFSHLDVTLQ